MFHEAMNPDMLNMMNKETSESGDTVAAAVAMDIQTYHTFAEEAARIARDAEVDHLVLNQILQPIPASILHPEFLGDSHRIYDGPITVSYDGMPFRMPRDSVEIDRQWLLK